MLTIVTCCNDFYRMMYELYRLSNDQSQANNINDVCHMQSLYRSSEGFSEIIYLSLEFRYGFF